jgi:hypothetical protein
VLLNFLEGATVFLSVAALVILSAALLELWIQRNEPKDPEYILTMLVLKWLSVAGWFICVLLTGNYVWRFYNGLLASRVQGVDAEVASTLSLVSFIGSYSFFSLIGVVFMYLLWQSDRPTPEERERRRRVARRRLEAERQRRLRRTTIANNKGEGT